MLRPLLLLGAFICAGASYCQKTDTLVIFYQTDKYNIPKEDKQKLDSFIARGWDRLVINGYTDEVDGNDYNLRLSERRSGEVYRYCRGKNFPDSMINARYFGEVNPMYDNDTEEGRALNRRTEIIGYRYARPVVKVSKPPEDPMKPVTKSLDNGFIITYRPGAIPLDMLDNFESGSSSNFYTITNTMEMRQNNLYNNTTRGEILSSVTIMCASNINPCKLDSPILVKIPIPETTCPITKVKFFNAVVEEGRQIWEEQNKQIFFEDINGKKYVGVWMNDFCQCINYDFKIDNDCWSIDSTQLLYTNADIRGLSTELLGMNSVYVPRQVNEHTSSIVHLKGMEDDALISFRLYNGKKRIRSFYNQRLGSIPYDSINGNYVLSTGTHRFYFPDLKVHNISIKVNNRDRYRVYPDTNECAILYLNRPTEKTTVDFMVIGRKQRITTYSNISLESIPFDEARGARVISKQFLQALKEKEKLSLKTGLAGR